MHMHAITRCREPQLNTRQSQENPKKERNGGLKELEGSKTSGEQDSQNQLNRVYKE